MRDIMTTSWSLYHRRRPLRNSKIPILIYKKHLPPLLRPAGGVQIWWRGVESSPTCCVLHQREKKRPSFLPKMGENRKFLLTPFTENGILTHAPPGAKMDYCIAAFAAVSSKGPWSHGPNLTGGVSRWQRNVPISPRSCTPRRSMASAREWLPPTVARSWPVAAPRAAHAFPTEEAAARGDTSICV